MATTSNETLRHRILVVLSAYPAGARRRRDVLDDLDEAFHDTWTADDRSLTPETRQVTWRVNASWERNAMREEGLLEEGADRPWVLTPAGVRAAEAAIQGSIAEARRGVPEGAWPLMPGDTLSRQDRMTRFGGGKYGGIEPSGRTPNVFVYSDPTAGSPYGYNYDGWTADGSHFLYTGEGRRGDQKLREGNKALLEHAQQGRAVRLFVADGREPGSDEKIQRYVGEFSVDSSNPVARAEAPDVLGIPRSVLVFRLKPMGRVFHRVEDASKASDTATSPSAEAQPLDETSPEAIAASIPLEAVASTSYETVAGAGHEAVRREAALVERFLDHLARQGHQAGRWRLRPPGELRYLYTDIFDHSENVLYEAKAAATRDNVRMAVGQLLDYRRHLPTTPGLAVLLPSSPSSDLIDLLTDLGIKCVYEEGENIFREAPGTTRAN
jgi:hypothetical protein